MRKDVREFIRRLEAVGLTVDATPGHFRVLRDGKPLRKANLRAVVSGRWVAVEREVETKLARGLPITLLDYRKLSRGAEI